jgi:hypothetical protein
MSNSQQQSTRELKKQHANMTFEVTNDTKRRTNQKSM